MDKMQVRNVVKDRGDIRRTSCRLYIIVIVMI